METNLPALFLIGTAGGFAAGLLGIGGGIVLVPLLAYVGGLSFHAATTVSVVHVLVSSVSGVQRHHRLGSINIRVALLLGVSSAATAALAAALAPTIPSLWLQIAFFVLLVASAIVLALPKRRSLANHGVEPESLPTVAIGMAAGAVTGLLGAGGGFFMVPLLIYVLRLRTKVAIGTSLAAIVLGSLSGALSKLVTGQIDYGLTAAVIVGGALGAQLGALTSARLPAVVLRRLLFALLIVIAVRTIVGIYSGDL
jgi:uncharacterized membrane protein YfcA